MEDIYFLQSVSDYHSQCITRVPVQNSVEVIKTVFSISVTRTFPHIIELYDLQESAETLQAEISQLLKERYLIENSRVFSRASSNGRSQQRLEEISHKVNILEHSLSRILQHLFIQFCKCQILLRQEKSALFL